MDIIAIAGLAAMVLAKEAGVPIPVPGDLVIIGAGATLYDDLPFAGVVLGIILLAGFIGASIQFVLFGSALRGPLLGALKRLGIGPERLEPLSERLRSGGVASIAVARMTPGVRIGVIPAAAIAGIPYRRFLPGIVIGNTVFVAAHFALGFVVGTYAHDLMLRYGPIVLVVGVVLVAVAIAGWLILRRRRKAQGQADAYECWADCSCPACVALLARR